MTYTSLYERLLILKRHSNIHLKIGKGRHREESAGKKKTRTSFKEDSKETAKGEAAEKNISTRFEKKDK